jgi:hypothetical protein
MAIDLEKNLHRIRHASVRAAFETLVARADEHGLEAADLTGFITGIKVYRDNQYVFAVQSNPDHLNFYIRKPAMKRWGPFEQRAATLGEVRANKKGEIQLHIHDASQADRVAELLFSLP